MSSFPNSTPSNTRKRKRSSPDVPIWTIGLSFDFWLITDEVKQNGAWFVGNLTKHESDVWLVGFESDNTTEEFTTNKLKTEWNEGNIRM